jgi:mono/diheme cytochrome c family protein
VLAASIVLFAVATVAVGYTGYLGGQMVFASDNKEKSEKPATVQASPTNTTASKPTGDPVLVSMGQQLFEQQRCSNCHAIGNTGGSAGPDLTHEGSDEPDVKWQMQHIQNPAKVTPGSSMPAYASLTQQQLLALATYVVSNK